MLMLSVTQYHGMLRRLGDGILNILQIPEISCIGVPGIQFPVDMLADSTRWGPAK
jgi:hypothetical protein